MIVNLPPSQTLSWFVTSACNKLGCVNVVDFEEVYRARILIQSWDLLLTCVKTHVFLRRMKWNTSWSGRKDSTVTEKNEKAKLHPNHYCPVIFDGADRSAFGLPFFGWKTSRCPRTCVDVGQMELTDHLGPNKFIMFTISEEHETGANHVMEEIYRFIDDHAKSGPLFSTFFI